MSIHQISSVQNRGRNFFHTINDELVSPAKTGSIVVNTKKDQSKILVVEDDLISQRVARLALENMGYKVDIAGTGKKALKLFATNCYQAVLMDMGLPDIPGTQVTYQIREFEQAKGIHTPIIALTAHGEMAKKECIKAGMDDFFSKPLDIEPLRDLLKSWIEKSN
jgi:CheY-like chemotaxis protein